MEVIAPLWLISAATRALGFFRGLTLKDWAIIAICASIGLLALDDWHQHHNVAKRDKIIAAYVAADKAAIARAKVADANATARIVASTATINQNAKETHDAIHAVTTPDKTPDDFALAALCRELRADATPSDQLPAACFAGAGTQAQGNARNGK